MPRRRVPRETVHADGLPPPKKTKQSARARRRVDQDAKPHVVMAFPPRHGKTAAAIKPLDPDRDKSVLEQMLDVEGTEINFDESKPKKKRTRKPRMKK